MRTARRPAQMSRILTNGLAASLALWLVLTGCANTADSREDRAAGAAGGQSRRDDGGPAARPHRVALSSPAAPSAAESDRAGAAERGSEEWRVRAPAAGRIAGYSTAPGGRPLGAKTARFVGVVTGNVLRCFATGPAKGGRPFRDNVRDFALDLSPANTVSAS